MYRVYVFGFLFLVSLVSLLVHELNWLCKCVERYPSPEEELHYKNVQKGFESYIVLWFVCLIVSVIKGLVNGTIIW